MKMYHRNIFVVFAVFLLTTRAAPAAAILLVVPEDVATGFAAIYGFSPRLLFGGEHRVGFGFRFGNHADLQLLYELGPQPAAGTAPPKVRSARVRARSVRRRPLLGLLLRAGLLHEDQDELDYELQCDQPR